MSLGPTVASRARRGQAGALTYAERVEEKETASGPDAAGVADVRGPAEPEGAEQPSLTGIPAQPVGVAAAPPSHGPTPAGRRRLPRLGSVLRRRRPFLEEDRVDPESVPVDGAEDPAVAAVAVESPVLTGFLLAVGVALAIGVDPAYIVASAPACYGYYILPTYPSDLAAIQFDRSGTTHIGRFVINHSFILPGLIGVSVSCVFGWVFAAMYGFL